MCRRSVAPAASADEWKTFSAIKPQSLAFFAIEALSIASANPGSKLQAASAHLPDVPDVGDCLQDNAVVNVEVFIGLAYRTDGAAIAGFCSQ